MRWPFPLPPRLDWLQIEMSSHCNASCSYCPRTLVGTRWPSGLLDPALFEELTPILRRTRLAFLQGWGEPFTHPDFFRFVAIAKAAGCQVGTTTNGMLLDEERCRRLVSDGVDLVAFSLAGATAATNDHWRSGAPLHRVLAAIDRLARCRREAGADRPAIHVAYLLLRSHLNELHQLPTLLADRGIDQVVISTLDLVLADSLEPECLQPETEAECATLHDQLEQLVVAGRQVGLAVHYGFPLPPGAVNHPDLDCVEDPCHGAFVTADGRVAPCVFLGLPTSGSTAAAEDAAWPLPRPSFFGNLNTKPFTAIWRSRASKDFRRAHRKGPLPPACRQCTKVRLCTPDL